MEQGPGCSSTCSLLWLVPCSPRTSMYIASHKAGWVYIYALNVWILHYPTNCAHRYRLHVTSKSLNAVLLSLANFLRFKCSHQITMISFHKVLEGKSVMMIIYRGIKMNIPAQGATETSFLFCKASLCAHSLFLSLITIFSVFFLKLSLSLSFLTVHELMLNCA